MKPLTTLKLVFCLLICCSGFGQNETSNWYFGNNAGLKFNKDGSVSELLDGQLATSEGCATISDDKGNLLFYSDGITVWNKKHEVMPDISGKTDYKLFGNPSSTHSAIIAQKPDEKEVFFLFTVDTESPQDNDNKGLNYSIIDLNENAGLGAITEKNINLLENCSEKISAVVKDCLTQSIWVIAFSALDGKDDTFDTFHAFEITDNDSRVIPTPVSSRFDDLKVKDPRGAIKFSPNGERLAIANARNGLYLFDFDAETGKVSNNKSIDVNIKPASKPQYPYGIEFSQSSNKLYVTTYFNPQVEIEFTEPSLQFGALLQYDLNSADISATEYIVQQGIQYRGSLQLGPNGRIYRSINQTHESGSNFISVINSPNSPGSECDYEHNSIKLKNIVRQGLPPFITSFFAQKIDIIGNNFASIDLDLCDGDSYILKASNIPDAKYIWTRNGLKLPENDFDLQVSTPGVYEVFIDANFEDCKNSFEGIANVKIIPEIKAYNAQLWQCDEDGIPGGINRFNLNLAKDQLTGGLSNLKTKFYKDSNRTEEIIDSQEYYFDDSASNLVYVEVLSNSAKCFDFATLELNTSLMQYESFTYDTLCDEVNSEDGINVINLDDLTLSIQNRDNISYPIKYYRTFDDALLDKRQFGDRYSNGTRPYNDKIFARIGDDSQCNSIIEVFLKVKKLPNIGDDVNLSFCSNEGNPIELFAEKTNGFNSDHSYLWSNGATTPMIRISTPGVYSVDVFNKNNCYKKRTFTIKAPNIAEFQDPSFHVENNTFRNKLTILIEGSGTYKYALYDKHNNQLVKPYQISNIFEDVLPNIYTVRVKETENNCGTSEKQISVIGFPKFFSPNNDGFKDTWQVLGVSEMFEPNTKIKIFNRYGKLVKELKPLSDGWDGLWNGSELPTDDYWFVVKFKDGTIYKNHFTLKK